MRTAVLFVLLAFAAAADASRINVVRSLLTYNKHEPRYCDPYAQYDECDKQYGHGWECNKLHKKECTYRDECKQVQTGKCKEYGYEHKCHYVQGGCKAYNQRKECRDEKFCVEYKQEERCETKQVCKAYNQKQECRDESFCVEYKQEQKCETKQVCKAYEQIQECKPNHKCAEYGQYGKCTRYGQDCHYKQGGCKEYETQQHNCKYHPTNECIKYDSKKVDCKYVQTDCKEYETQKHNCKYHPTNECAKYDSKEVDCKYVQTDCKKYETQKHNCRYHPTNECTKYDSKKVDCKYVNTDCKEYEQVQKCDKVKGGCKSYEYKNECHKVEDVCWTGKCDKKTYQKPAPKHSYGDYGR